MQYEIVDGEVLEVTEVVTEVQTAIVKVGRGREKKIVLSVDKAIINNGIDKAVITAHLQDWQNNAVMQAVAVRFEVNGAVLDRITDAGGVTSIEFTSLTPGQFNVSCSAPGYDFGLAGVTVNVG